MLEFDYVILLTQHKILYVSTENYFLSENFEDFKISDGNFLILVKDTTLETNRYILLSIDFQQKWSFQRDPTGEVYSSDKRGIRFTHIRELQYTYLLQKRNKENI